MSFRIIWIIWILLNKLEIIKHLWLIEFHWFHYIFQLELYISFSNLRRNSSFIFQNLILLLFFDHNRHLTFLWFIRFIIWFWFLITTYYTIEFKIGSSVQKAFLWKQLIWLYKLTWFRRWAISLVVWFAYEMFLHTLAYELSLCAFILITRKGYTWMRLRNHGHILLIFIT